MNHLDEGTITAIRDRTPVDADAREHLATCVSCRTALDDARHRTVLVERSLATLEQDVDLAAAKAAVRARIDAARDAEVDRGGRLRSHLGRAAAVLLVAAGAVYALPGSPLREWTVGTDEVQPPNGPLATPPQEAPSRGGIEVNVPDGRMEVVLRGVEAGSFVDVVWSESATARISAAAGSSFSFGDGRAEATVAPGPIVVALPRFASVISLEVDGRTFLRRSSGALEVLEPTVERSEDRLRFVVRAR